MAAPLKLADGQLNLAAAKVARYTRIDVTRMAIDYDRLRICCDKHIAVFISIIALDKP